MMHFVVRKITIYFFVLCFESTRARRIVNSLNLKIAMKAMARILLNSFKI